RDYQEVTSYTITDELPVDPTAAGNAPYFIARLAGDREADSRQFSSAELWVQYLYWFLNHVNKGSTVLIDEPEAFIADYGHRALADELARYAIARDLQIVVATHSPSILSRFPLRHIRMCCRLDGLIRVEPP